MKYKRPDVTDKMKESAKKLVKDVLQNGVKAGIKTDIEKAAIHIDKFYKTVLNRTSPKQLTVVASPEAAISAAIALTGEKRENIIKQIIFLNLWTWYPTRAWAALNIREIDPKKEGILDRVVRFTNEKFEMSKDIHAILCCEQTCFIIEFPMAFSAEYNEKSFTLHRDGAPAIEYSDNTGFSWLHNVEVPNWVACTPIDELDVKKIMSLANVDIRREGLARIPISRLIKDLDMALLNYQELGPVDWLKFEIFTADFKDDKKRVILKMFDPSSKSYCFERVQDDAQKCDDALAWRDGEEKYIVPMKRT